jgi:Protein of unknown function DUF262
MSVDSEPEADEDQELAVLDETEDIVDIDESLEVVESRYSITSYGADYPVDGLVQRLNRGSIRVPSFNPEVSTASGIVGFQREFVWTKSQADRFVESLLLGLPVPGIFLVQEPDNVLLVLDGQQRLGSLQAFYNGIFKGKEFRLSYVEHQFKGLSYADLPGESQRRLDDSIIHATIVRQDERSDDQSAIYFGVIREPPPIPVIPTSKPTANPNATRAGSTAIKLSSPPGGPGRPRPARPAARSGRRSPTARARPAARTGRRCP